MMPECKHFMPLDSVCDKCATESRALKVAQDAFAAFMQGFNDHELGKPSGRTDDLYLMGRNRAKQLELLEADRIG